MRAEDLPNELDRKHAQREERRRCVRTYTRKLPPWYAGTKYDWHQNIEKYDQKSEQEYQDGKPRDD